MADFCPDCVRKVFGVDRRDKDFVLSDDLCFCEECCEWKKVVICEKGFDCSRFKLFNIVKFFKRKRR